MVTAKKRVDHPCTASELRELLELAKSTAARAGTRLLETFGASNREYVPAPDNPREIKTLADRVLEKDILDALIPTGLSILSEESGFIRGPRESECWFIVDPLDGTFNFAKGLGPSAVSIALWAAQKPMFGVVYDLHDRQLVWGGAGLDAYANGMRIRVSDVSSLGQASLCTGFPARFDFAIEPGMNDFWRLASTVGKIRMLGSASVSLLHVARGSADAYAERSIMLWDVAAGLAIVEGAGGSHVATQTNVEWSYNVIASNTNLISGLSKT